MSMMEAAKYSIIQRNFSLDIEKISLFTLLKNFRRNIITSYNNLLNKLVDKTISLLDKN